jgi:hypothetical protein
MPESIDAWCHRCLQRPFHPQHQHQPTAKKKTLRDRPPTNTTCHNTETKNQHATSKHTTEPSRQHSSNTRHCQQLRKHTASWTLTSGTKVHLSGAKNPFTINYKMNEMCCRQWLWRGSKENRREESRAFTSSSKFYQACPLKTRIGQQENKGLSDHEL